MRFDMSIYYLMVFISQVFSGAGKEKYREILPVEGKETNLTWTLKIFLAFN